MRAAWVGIDRILLGSNEYGWRRSIVPRIRSPAAALQGEFRSWQHFVGSRGTIMRPGEEIQPMTRIRSIEMAMAFILAAVGSAGAAR